MKETTVAEEKHPTMETENYLPHELIIQILLRLPVKSLIQFKCVCKSWFSIISDTQFANSQFELNAATHTHRALFMSRLSPHKTRSVDLESIDDDSAFASHEYPTSLIKTSDLLSPVSRIRIEGSCRGFILLYCSFYSSYYLWNPSTGLHNQIPLSTFKLDDKVDHFYGFGYDQSTDDYLMVSMLSDRNSSYLEFFSLRANMWKHIDGTHIHYLNYIEDYYIKPGLLFNGAIHWFGYRPDLDNNVIVAFDLMKRKLLDMNLPDEFDHALSNCDLWVFQDFISVWAKNYSNGTVEIWVMKEYKLHSSWTKTYVLPTHAVPIKFFSPLSYTKNGDIVGTGLSGFVKFNDEGQLLGHHFYSNNPYGSVAVMYTESLLSLPGDNVQA